MHRIASCVAAAVAPALLGQIALNSFDLWPAALAGIAVLLVVEGRPRGGLAFLAASTAAKLYPVLLAPARYAYVERRHGRDVALRSLAVGGAVLVAIFLPFAVVAHGGLGYSLWEQTTRGLQVEGLGGSIFGVAHRLGAATHVVVSTTPFSYDLAGRGAAVVAAISSLLVLVAVYVVQRVLHAGPISLDRTILAAAAAAVGFVAFGKVLSPQYLLFLVALVPLVGRLLPIVLFGVALALTQIWARFPEPFGQVSGLRNMIWITFVRNLVLVALFLELLRELAHSQSSTGKPARTSKQSRA